MANQPILTMSPFLLLGQVPVLPAIRSLLEKGMLLAMIVETIDFADDRSTNAPI